MTTAEGSRLRQVLAQPEARALLIAQVASEIGDQIARVAVSYYVLNQTDSLLWAALTLALAYVPGIFGTAALGTLADRLPRRALMLWCDLLRLLIVVVLAAVIVFEAPLVLAFALLLISETASAPFTVARSALWPDVMPDRDLFVTVHALSRSIYLGAQVFGFIAGGLLLNVLGVGEALLFDAFTFLLSYLLIRSQVDSRPAVEATGASVGQVAVDVRTGYRDLFDDPLRRWVVLLAWGSAAFLIAPEAVALGWRPGLSPTIGGILLAAVPAGAAIGYLLMPRLPLPRQVEIMLPLAALSCLPLFASSVDPAPLVVAALWFLSGVMQGWVLTAMATVTVLTPRKVRGRVIGVAASGFSAATALSFAVVGALGDAVGPAKAVSLAGALGLVVVGIAKLRDPSPALAEAVAAADLTADAEEVIELLDSRAPIEVPDEFASAVQVTEPVDVSAAVAAVSDPPSVPDPFSAPLVRPVESAWLPTPDHRHEQTESLVVPQEVVPAPAPEPEPEPEPEPVAPPSYAEAVNVLRGQPMPSWTVPPPADAEDEVDLSDQRPSPWGDDPFATQPISRN